MIEVPADLDAKLRSAIRAALGTRAAAPQPMPQFIPYPMPMMPGYGYGYGLPDDAVLMKAREGLVSKQITNKAGRKQTVWVRPTPKAKAAPKAKATAKPKAGPAKVVKPKAAPAAKPKAPRAAFRTAPVTRRSKGPTVDETHVALKGMAERGEDHHGAVLDAIKHHTVKELAELGKKLGIKAKGVKANHQKAIASRPQSKRSTALVPVGEAKSVRPNIPEANAEHVPFQPHELPQHDPRHPEHAAYLKEKAGRATLGMKPKAAQPKPKTGYTPVIPGAKLRSGADLEPDAEESMEDYDQRQQAEREAGEDAGPPAVTKLGGPASPGTKLGLRLADPVRDDPAHDPKNSEVGHRVHRGDRTGKVAAVERFPHAGGTAQFEMIEHADGRHSVVGHIHGHTNDKVTGQTYPNKNAAQSAYRNSIDAAKGSPPSPPTKAKSGGVAQRSGPLVGKVADWLGRLMKAFDESKHPRGDNGRFVSKMRIEEAKKSPAAAARLKKEVTDPVQREKLDAALAEPESEVKTHEMTKQEFKGYEQEFGKGSPHDRLIKRAHARGERLHPAVAEDYPELGGKSEPEDPIDFAMDGPADAYRDPRVDAINAAKIASGNGTKPWEDQGDYNPFRAEHHQLADATTSGAPLPAESVHSPATGQKAPTGLVGGPPHKDHSVDRTAKLAASLKDKTGDAHAKATSEFHRAMGHHTHAEIAELKAKLGIRASGSKANQAKLLAARAAQSNRDDRRHFVHAAMTVDEAHELVKNHDPDAPGASVKLATALTRGLTGKQLGELKSRLGVKASGAKWVMANRVAKRVGVADKVAPLENGGLFGGDETEHPHLDKLERMAARSGLMMNQQFIKNGATPEQAKRMGVTPKTVESVWEANAVEKSNTPDIEKTITDYVDKVGRGVGVPFNQIHDHLKSQGIDLSIGQFHETLRGIHDKKNGLLTGWSKTLYDLPPGDHAMMDSKKPLYLLSTAKHAIAANNSSVKSSERPYDAGVVKGVAASLGKHLADGKTADFNELMSRVKEDGHNPTVGEFHDAMANLTTEGKIKLNDFDRTLYDLPHGELAKFHNGKVTFGATGTSPAPAPEDDGGTAKAEAFAKELAAKFAKKKPKSTDSPKPVAKAEPKKRGRPAKDAVKAALKSGNAVPDEVLADYPDLAAKHGKVTPSGGAENAPAPQSTAPAHPHDSRIAELQAKLAERDAAWAKGEVPASAAGAHDELHRLTHERRRDLDPRPPMHHDGDGHTWAQAQNGDWHVKVKHADARPGDTVSVRSRSGRIKVVKLGADTLPHPDRPHSVGSVAKEETEAAPAEPVAESTPVEIPAPPKAPRMVDPDRPKLEYVRAKAGGEISEVDGKHYPGGQLMPIHGKYSGQEKAPPKAKREFVTSSNTATGEDGEEKERRQPAQRLSPDELRRELARQRDQKMWDEIRTGPFGDAARHAPNAYASDFAEDTPPRALPGRVPIMAWRKHVEQHGPEYVRKIIAEAAPIAGGMDDWDSDQIAESIADKGKSHEKLHPGSHQAHYLIRRILEKGGDRLESLHAVNELMKRAKGSTAVPNKSATSGAVHVDAIGDFYRSKAHLATTTPEEVTAAIAPLADMAKKDLVKLADTVWPSRKHGLQSKNAEFIRGEIAKAIRNTHGSSQRVLQGGFGLTAKQVADNVDG